MIDAGGWLKTGDIGSVDERDRCLVDDRIKKQIKYNAYQVAPAELEAVLISHPAVVDAALIGVPVRQQVSSRRCSSSSRAGR